MEYLTDLRLNIGSISRTAGIIWLNLPHAWLQLVYLLLNTTPYSVRSTLSHSPNYGGLTSSGQ